MKTRRRLLTLAPIAALSFGLGCHGDGLYFHDCTENFWESGGWDAAELEFDHYDPRLCPVEMPYPEASLLMSASILDDLPRDFWSSEFWIRNSSNATINGPQYDYFHEHDLGGGVTEWMVEIYASYPVGSGSNACYDKLEFKMASRYPGNPGGLPSADGNMTYLYDSYPPCP